MPAIHAMTAITCSALIHSYIGNFYSPAMVGNFQPINVVTFRRTIALKSMSPTDPNGSLSASGPFLKQ
jgi:hypothetical protein